MTEYYVVHNSPIDDFKGETYSVYPHSHRVSEKESRKMKNVKVIGEKD